MSLSKKITEEMAAMAYRILNKIDHASFDERSELLKIKKMVQEYNKLKELLEMTIPLEVKVKAEKKAQEVGTS